jgi:hypothetical protein
MDLIDALHRGRAAPALFAPLEEVGEQRVGVKETRHGVQLGFAGAAQKQQQALRGRHAIDGQRLYQSGLGSERGEQMLMNAIAVSYRIELGELRGRSPAEQPGEPGIELTQPAEQLVESQPELLQAASLGLSA